MPDAIARLNDALRDRYTVERELGEGGMATVYLAHDVRHNRNVALKVLKPELAAVIGGERFLQEISGLADVQRPPEWTAPSLNAKGAGRTRGFDSAGRWKPTSFG